MLERDKKLGFLPLVGLIIGSVIGGGVFNLSTDMAKGAGSFAVIISWIISGIGMVAIGLCFKNLNEKRPDLNVGIYCYARAGFGDFMGFISAWGYWLSIVLANVAYATLLFSSIDYFIPIFNGGQNVASIIGASIMLWSIHFLILRGVHEAAVLNLITVIAKLVPVFVFIVCMIVAFKYKVFVGNLWGDTTSFSWQDIGMQVKSTMLVTIWAFSGIEGAAIFSRRAKNRKDIGKATIFGVIGVLIIYMLVTLLAFGAMSQSEVASLKNPSMAYLLEAVVGKWGAVLINIGLIISILGAWLGWTLIVGEIPYQAAKDKLFPKWFTKENMNSAPSHSLWISNGLVQLFILSFIISDEAYTFLYSLSASICLFPYVFSAFYQVKYSLYSKQVDSTKNLFVGFVASIYGIWLVIAAGLKYLLLTVVLMVPGIIIFYLVQKEDNRKLFTKGELALVIAFIVLFIFAIQQLTLGAITI